MLRAGGRAVHILTKGYGGSKRGPLRVDPQRHTAAQVGDEALLLAAAAPAWIARDRRAGARAALSQGAELLLLDDGLQDPSLATRLALLVVDGGYGFGNGRVLPAGPLREPLARGLTRADAVVLVGRDSAGVTDALAGALPILRARFLPTRRAERLTRRRVFAFAGIGRPEKFFETLAESGCEIAGTHTFPDHHPYRPEEIMAVCEAASAARAVPVTTEKDAVRLPPEARPMVEVFPVTLEWQDPAAVEALLAGLLRTALPA
jgi:tetraacyldisaccharide 4'-kinase